jgi:hypothetical protein
MKTNIFDAKGHAAVGPGGWTCTCCGPAPKHRKLFARLLKKRLYKVLDRLERDCESR